MGLFDKVFKKGKKLFHAVNATALGSAVAPMALLPGGKKALGKIAGGGEDGETAPGVDSNTSIPAEMPSINSAASIKARRAVLRKKKKGSAASNIKTGLAGQGTPNAPVTALDAEPSGTFLDDLAGIDPNSFGNDFRYWRDQTLMTNKKKKPTIRYNQK